MPEQGKKDGVPGEIYSFRTYSSSPAQQGPRGRPPLPTHHQTPHGEEEGQTQRSRQHPSSYHQIHRQRSDESKHNHHNHHHRSHHPGSYTLFLSPGQKDSSSSDSSSPSVSPRELRRRTKSREEEKDGPSTWKTRGENGEEGEANSPEYALSPAFTGMLASEISTSSMAHTLAEELEELEEHAPMDQDAELLLLAIAAVDVDDRTLVQMLHQESERVGLSYHQGAEEEESRKEQEVETTEEKERQGIETIEEGQPLADGMLEMSTAQSEDLQLCETDIFGENSYRMSAMERLDALEEMFPHVTTPRLRTYTSPGAPETIYPSLLSQSLLERREGENKESLAIAALEAEETTPLIPAGVKPRTLSTGTALDHIASPATASQLKEQSLKEKERDREELISMFWSVWNLMNDVLGAGVVTVPFFVINSGLVGGLLLMLVMAFLSHTVLVMIHHICRIRSTMNFVEMCYLALGRPGYILSCLAIFAFNWGGLVGNVMVLGSMLPDLLTAWMGPSEWFSRTNCILASFLLLSPVTFKRSLSSFNLISFLSIVAIASLVVLIIYVTLHDMAVGEAVSSSHVKEDRHQENSFIRSGMVAGLGGLAYIFACHDFAFHVMITLEEPTWKRWAVVSGIALTTTFGILVILSICCYLLYGDNVHDSMVDNLGNNLPANICRLLLSLNIIVNVPYCLYMPRVSILALIQMKFPQYVLKTKNNRFQRDVVHVLVTTVLLITSLVFCILVSDIGAVFSVVGGLSGVMISLILPAICWLRLSKRLSAAQQAFGVTLVVFGVSCLIIVGIWS